VRAIPVFGSPVSIAVSGSEHVARIDDFAAVNAVMHRIIWKAKRWTRHWKNRSNFDDYIR
jgi:hypothetical protein